jgi:hypothetical protein
MTITNKNFSFEINNNLDIKNTIESNWFFLHIIFSIYVSRKFNNIIFMVIVYNSPKHA